MEKRTWWAKLTDEQRKEFADNVGNLVGSIILWRYVARNRRKYVPEEYQGLVRHVDYLLVLLVLNNRRQTVLLMRMLAQLRKRDDPRIEALARLAKTFAQGRGDAAHRRGA
jgi:hypothetical protein